MSRPLFGIDKLVDSMLADYEADLRSEFDLSFDSYGIMSPIEKMFFVGAMRRILFWPTFRPYKLVVRFKHPFPNEIKDRSLYFCTQCVVIDTWPVDFVFALRNGDAGVKIAVECDGHDFHERTKEQAARDRLRDRELQRLGFKIFRFTGSEIYRDPLACVEEVSAQLRFARGAPPSAEPSA